MIDDDWHVRLTDFGLTTLAEASTRTNGTAGGLIPVAWAACELLDEAFKRPTYACDVFSFGRTCVEVRLHFILAILLMYIPSRGVDIQWPKTVWKPERDANLQRDA